MNRIAYTVLGFAAVASWLFVALLRPSAWLAALLAAWLVLPYAMLAVAVRLGAGRAGQIAGAVTSAIVAAAGLLFLTDVILLHPDPQGGIAVFFTPIYQVLALIVLLPVCRQLAEKWLQRAAQTPPSESPPQ
ncbi:MAG TPA: hypothetical protein VGI18_10840 [Burkholderiales bacterium]|jgi:hypothetical protein